MTDLHELNLTSSGTALITAYETTTADLSSVGQKRTGKVFVGHAQEIDLKTGKVLFDWRSLDHVPLSESFQNPPANPKGTFDYFHINSVAEMDDGNLLISGRNTWTLYKVDRSSGKIIWRLNGKRSNFSVSTAAQFYWQHHARQNGTSGLTVFDNAGPNKERQSRGLSLTVDTSAMRVDLAQAYIHPARFLSNTLGSVQVLGDGRVFVGWGDQPYFSEFAPDGTLLLNGQLPVGVRSYRTFAADWVGQPADASAGRGQGQSRGRLRRLGELERGDRDRQLDGSRGSQQNVADPGRLAALGRVRDADRRQLDRPLFRGRRDRPQREGAWALAGRLRPAALNSHATADATNCRAVLKRLWGVDDGTQQQRHMAERQHLARTSAGRHSVRAARRSG